MRAVAHRLADEFDAVVAGSPDVDRHEVFARLRDELPLFHSDALYAWVVSRHADAKAVLELRDVFVPVTEGPGAAIFGRGFFHWRGREHGKKSGFLARRIRSPRALRTEIGPRVGEIAERVAGTLPLGVPIDLREEYAVRVPLLVISELTAIDEVDKLRHWLDAIMAGGTSSIGNPAARAAGLQAVEELKELLAPLIAERRLMPGDDLVSDLVHARYDGKPFPEEEIMAVVVQLLPAGVETTERVLTSAFGRLAEDPALWAAVRERRASDSALSAFGAEALRLHPPIQAVNRVALADAELAGDRVAAGEKVVALIASANRDGAVFPDAERFDLDRFAGNPSREYTPTGDVLPFGGGEHHCTGSRLAESEIVQVVRALADRVQRIELLEPAPEVGGLVLWSPASLRVILHAA